MIFRTSILRTILPFVQNLGSAAFRRHVIEWLPVPIVQEMKGLVDTLYGEAERIVADAQEALDGGDEGTKQLVSEGKDILSVLRKRSELV